jgi:hypothetical protein
MLGDSLAIVRNDILVRRLQIAGMAATGGDSVVRGGGV